MGWLIDYLSRLLHWYPSFTDRYVMKELPMIQGWALYAASMEHDPWIRLSGIERSSPGYVKQEVERLILIAKHGR